MARYRLLERAFINQTLWEPGAEVTVADDVNPRSSYGTSGCRGQTAFKKTGFVNGASLQHDIVDKIADFGASPAGVNQGMNASQ